jgi:hypothetical protein
MILLAPSHPNISPNRAPRETPGWRPGGRFLFHADGQSMIEDMQEREQYAARKARAKARQVAEREKV